MSRVVVLAVLSGSVRPPKAAGDCAHSRLGAVAQRAAHFASTVALALLAAFPDSLASAQSAPNGGAGAIQGRVVDSSGSGIADVHISVPGAPVMAVSDARGEFRIANVPAGPRTVRTRRIGFRPDSVLVMVTAGRATEANVRLVATPQHVTPVIVTAARTSHTGRLRSFYERREKGLGRFFSAEDIAARRPRVVTDLIRTIPGARLINHNGARIVTFRDHRCLPLVWVDGSPASTAYLDPDLFTPSSLAGIEVYAGLSTVPPELTLARGKSSCGVIALWTNVPEPRGTSTPRKVTAEDLSLLVASLSLFTADQVEVPAGLDNNSPLQPVYPEAALRDGLTGRVVAEFIVETNGRPDMDSFAAVMSSDPRFTESVRRAVGAARFRPAKHGGRNVRQLLQLPFTFTIPESAGRGEGGGGAGA